MRVTKPGYTIGFSPGFMETGAVKADVEVKLRNILTGVVIESTLAGPRPVSGAVVGLCYYPEPIWCDGTTTGPDGSFSLQHPGPHLIVQKAGFRRYHTEVTVRGTVYLTVELVRE